MGVELELRYTGDRVMASGRREADRVMEEAIKMNSIIRLSKDTGGGQIGGGLQRQGLGCSTQLQDGCWGHCRTGGWQGQ